MSNTNEALQYEELTGSGKIYNASKMQVGDTFEGTYLEDKTMGQFEGLVHFFKSKTGERFGIGSTGQLKYWLGQIEPGTAVKLVYNGRSTNPKFAKKGKDKIPHEFKIAIVRPSGSLAAKAAPAKTEANAEEIDF